MKAGEVASYILGCAVLPEFMFLNLVCPHWFPDSWYGVFAVTVAWVKPVPFIFMNMYQRVLFS
jgi:hypothetical protein